MAPLETSMFLSPEILPKHEIDVTVAGGGICVKLVPEMQQTDSPAGGPPGTNRVPQPRLLRAMEHRGAKSSEHKPAEVRDEDHILASRSQARISNLSDVAIGQQLAKPFAFVAFARLEIPPDEVEHGWAVTKQKRAGERENKAHGRGVETENSSRDAARPYGRPAQISSSIA